MNNDDVNNDDVNNDIDELIARADLDGLIRLIDATCTHRDWQRLRNIGDSCRAAIHSGRQLWPAATLADYRLALRAPAPWATEVLRSDASRFTLGPLTEVIAQHHLWDELANSLPFAPQSTFVAYECALRGQTIETSDALFPALEIPVQCDSWEPTYQLAEYADNEAVFPAPQLPDTVRAELWSTTAGQRLDDHGISQAAHQLVESWTTQSNGRCEIVVTEGDALNALGALGVASVNLRELTSDTAMAWMAWAGASGGAHGRRRGAAAGRFSAWWVLAALNHSSGSGLLGSWPISSREANEVAEQWTWWWWDADKPATGWQLQLVAHNVTTNRAWAISANDAR